MCNNNHLKSCFTQIKISFVLYRLYNLIIIDIFSENIIPIEISRMPLELSLTTLRRITKKTLLSNEFEDDYVKVAKLIIRLDRSINRTLIYKSEVIDINNKIYECKEIIIKSYEDFFNVKDNLL